VVVAVEVVVAAVAEIQVEGDSNHEVFQINLIRFAFFTTRLLYGNMESQYGFSDIREL